MQIITAEWLANKKACADQVELFRATFGAAAPVTEANVLRALRAGLNVRWLAGHAPPPAWETCYAVIIPAWEAYRAAVVSGKAAYDIVYAEAWGAYHAAIAPALCAAILAIDVGCASIIGRR